MSVAVRRRACCDPCGGARTGSSDPRGCASAGGSRAPCDDGGCSAGTYACSREISETVRVTRSLDRTRGVGWHRPSAGAILVAREADTGRSRAAAGRRRLRGHAAPVDTGSTAQRYAVPFDRVKPTTGPAPCGQPLVTRDPRLLAFARPEIPHGRRPHPSRPHRALPRFGVKRLLTCVFTGCEGEAAPGFGRLTTHPGSMHNLWTKVWTGQPGRCRRSATLGQTPRGHDRPCPRGPARRPADERELEWGYPRE